MEERNTKTLKILQMCKEKSAKIIFICDSIEIEGQHEIVKVFLYMQTIIRIKLG